MNRIALSFLALAACATDDVDVDEALDTADAGKADSVEARHYLLTRGPANGEPGTFTVMRAGGGPLQCPDGSAADACTFTDLVTSPGVSASAGELVDELEDHALLLRGRLVKYDANRIGLRVTGVTRGITSVQPFGTCYRIRDLCGDNPNCYNFRFERLDAAEPVTTGHLNFDYVDPTPDFWGQPTAAAQAKIDRALALSGTRPVYTCGSMDDGWYDASQLFVPN